jgi:hypothetical protein
MTSFTATMTRISPSLATLLRLPGGDETYSQREIVRTLHAIYKEKVGNLNPAGDTLHFDTEMRTALNIPDGETVGVLNLAAILRPHCLDLPPIESYEE